MRRQTERIRKENCHLMPAIDGEHALTIDEAVLCEQLVGLTTAGEVCARWLRSDEPDLLEVKRLVDEMIVVSRRALTSLDR